MLLGDIESLSPGQMEFESFVWEQDEESETPRALTHLQTQSTKFGVFFGTSI